MGVSRMMYSGLHIYRLKHFAPTFPQTCLAWTIRSQMAGESDCCGARSGTLDGITLDENHVYAAELGLARTSVASGKNCLHSCDR